MTRTLPVDAALPELNAALFAHARRAAAAGRGANAVAVAREAASVRPCLQSALRLAGVLTATGDLEAARAILTPLAADDPGDACELLAEVALCEGRVEEAVALHERCVTANPFQGAVRYRLLSLLPHLGRFDETNRHAARGILITCGDQHLTSTRVIHFPDPTRHASQAVPFSRSVRFESGDAGGAEAVYVVGCDSRYLQLFGEALANSLARRAGARLLLHLHVVNPDGDASALLTRLRAQSTLSVAWSTENSDLSSLGERQRRTYLSCARYLVLPDLLSHYARPLIVADADQLVVGELRGLLADLSRHDVGLLRNDRQIANILSFISASVMGINATPGGERFAATLRDTVTERTHDPAGLGWHLDQAALAVAHLWCRDIRTLRLPPWIMDSVIDPTAAPDALDPRALFWSITMTHVHNARKLDTSLFRQFLEATAG